MALRPWFLGVYPALFVGLSQLRALPYADYATSVTILGTLLICLIRSLAQTYAGLRLVFLPLLLLVPYVLMISWARCPGTISFDPMCVQATATDTLAMIASLAIVTVSFTAFEGKRTAYQTIIQLRLGSTVTQLVLASLSIAQDFRRAIPRCHMTLAAFAQARPGFHLSNVTSLWSLTIMCWRYVTYVIVRRLGHYQALPSQARQARLSHDKDGNALQSDLIFLGWTGATMVAAFVLQ